MKTEISPIEIATHTRAFHENSPVFSVDIYDSKFLATCGSDKVIRLWKIIKKKLKITENVYRLLDDASIQFEFYKELGGFNSTVNVVRFSPDIQQSLEFIVAGSSDNKIVVFLNTQSYEIYYSSSDYCTDISWISKNYLLASFMSGKVILFKLEYMVSSEKEDSTNTVAETKNSIHVLLESEVINNQQLHDHMIRGIRYHYRHNCFITHSLDKTSQVWLIEGSKFTNISRINEEIDSSPGFYRRNGIDDGFIYVICRNRMLHVYCYPFSHLHLSKRIGPFTSSPVKVISSSYYIIVVCSKSIYFFDRQWNKKYFVESAAHGPIDDAAFDNNVLYYCSEDGFVSTIRIKNHNKLKAVSIPMKY